MTPKEKANELGNKMYKGSVFDHDKQGHLGELLNAKRCASLCVDEILNFYDRVDVEYWEQVKQEIENL